MIPTRFVRHLLGVLSPLLVPALSAPTPTKGQEPGSAEWLQRVRRVHAAVSATGRALGDDLWPDFDPGARPVLYTGLEQAVLVDWPGELPDGFESVPGLKGAGRSPAPSFGALMVEGTTFTSLDPSYGPAAATALAVHEHFHAHQRESAARGAAFGRGERPGDVRLYPAFDTTNAALLALEGRLLAAALRGGVDDDTARERARDFLIVRQRRRSRLDRAARAWERGTERNEGLAAYLAHRTLGWLAREDHRGWGGEAEREIARRISRLEDLTEVAEASLRRVFYVTGSAQALLLDRLDPAWKHRMTTADRWLEGLLAAAVAEEGSRPTGSFGAIAAREELSRLRAEVAASLARLAKRRRAEVERVLAAPGLRLILEAGERAQVCGLDPLNVLHAPDRRVVHPGFARLCSEDEGLSASFTGPSLERVHEGVFTVPAGPPGEVEIEAAGSKLSLEELVARGAAAAGRIVDRLEIRSPGITLEMDRARIVVDDGTLVVRPVRPDDEHRRVRIPRPPGAPWAGPGPGRAVRPVWWHLRRTAGEAAWGRASPWESPSGPLRERPWTASRSGCRLGLVSGPGIGTARPSASSARGARRPWPATPSRDPSRRLELTDVHDRLHEIVSRVAGRRVASPGFTASEPERVVLAAHRIDRS